ncbi:hypothetical protein QBC45DRAFT_339234, partial [Copromyces sp. CBS 386.78]
IVLLSIISKGIKRLVVRKIIIITFNTEFISKDSAGAVPTQSIIDLVIALVCDAEGVNRLRLYGIITIYNIDLIFSFT